jgi:predicted transcriptional regulator
VVSVEISESLAVELDQLAEAEHKRPAEFVAELLWQEVKRKKQRLALKLSAGVWNAADHPELADGGSAYVEAIRSKPDERFEDMIRLNQAP